MVAVSVVQFGGCWGDPRLVGVGEEIKKKKKL